MECLSFWWLEANESSNDLRLMKSRVIISSEPDQLERWLETFSFEWRAVVKRVEPALHRLFRAEGVVRESDVFPVCSLHNGLSFVHLRWPARRRARRTCTLTTIRSSICLRSLSFTCCSPHPNPHLHMIIIRFLENKTHRFALFHSLSFAVISLCSLIWSFGVANLHEPTNALSNCSFCLFRHSLVAHQVQNEFCFVLEIENQDKLVSFDRAFLISRKLTAIFVQITID